MRNFKTILVIALVLFALMLAGKSRADEAPTDEKGACTQWCKPYWKSMPKLEYVYFAAEAADMFTTLDIKNHPELEEKNPLLGKHPSDAKIISMCVGAALIHSAITYEMVDQNVPRPIINAWEYISIAVEGSFAVHNLRMGLHFSF